jgi:hypothetical protein
LLKQRDLAALEAQRQLGYKCKTLIKIIFINKNAGEGWVSGENLIAAPACT